MRIALRTVVASLILLRLSLQVLAQDKSALNAILEKWQPSLTGNALASFASSVPDAYRTNGAISFGIAARNSETGTKLEAMLTITGVNDTVSSIDQGDFGASVLVPGVRRNSFLFSYRKPRIKGGQFGYGFYINTSKIDWSTFALRSQGATMNDSLLITHTVHPITAQAFASYLIWDSNPERKEEKESSWVYADLGLSLKYLGGDQLPSSAAELYLGSNQEAFPALHGGFSFHYNALRAFIYWDYVLAMGGQPEVAGLTRLQTVAGISISASIAKAGK